MGEEKLEKKVDKIATEVIRHTEVIKGLVTKKEFTDFKHENFSRLDKMMTILTRLDQERMFTFERVRRLEEEVNKIKSHLSIS